MSSLLADVVLRAVPDAEIVTSYAIGRLHRCDFKAPVPMVTRTPDVTPSDLFAMMIAGVAGPLFEGVKVSVVSAAVRRVEAMEALAAMPAKVYILSACFGGMMSGNETIGVYATRALAEAAAQGHHMPHIEEAVVQFGRDP